MNIYAGNLSRELTEDELKDAFAAYGAVDSAKIITDKFTGISRGFGFVEMPDEPEALNAIGELNGKDLKDRTIIVNKARPRSDQGGGRGGGFGGGGGGGFGNRRY